MKKYFGTMLSLIVLVTSGCGQGNDRLQEKAAIEGKASSQAAIDAENANLASKVQAMESDLDRRHKFYEALEGVYTGTLETESGEDFAVEVLFNSSLPRCPTGNRTRTLEELSYEVNNLYVVAQVKEWASSDTGPASTQAFGCIFEQVRPDIANGKVFLASEGCKKSYTFYFSEENPKPDTLDVADFRLRMSRDISSKIMKGSQTSVPGLVGVKRTNLSSKNFKLRLKKSESELGPKGS